MDRTPAMRQISCGGMPSRAAVVAPARPRGLAGEPLGFIGCHANVLAAAAEVAHVVLVHHEARGVDDAACTDCWENVLTLEHGACCSDNAVGADLGRVSRAGDVDEVACGLRVLALAGVESDVELVCFALVLVPSEARQVVRAREHIVRDDDGDTQCELPLPVSSPVEAHPAVDEHDLAYHGERELFRLLDLAAREPLRRCAAASEMSEMPVR